MRKKFNPNLPEASLTELYSRLKQARWPRIVGKDDWQFGVPQSWLKEMVEYWIEEWEWEKQRAQMNRWQHYKVRIEGITIHYLHAPAKNSEAPPIVLTHGWPWTFWDFKDVIGPLSDPESYGGKAENAFNVYVPSLPGFAFSEPLYKSKVDVARIASLWVQLMTKELGYKKFAAHGGDWGALITAHLAHAHPEKLLGAHMSLTLIPGVDRSSLTPTDYAPSEAWMLKRNIEAAPMITSHVSVHKLDPQTLAYGLTDSPVGTAAWIWERRRNWSDCNGDIESKFSRDHLCTTAALYWCTGTIGSSLRLYHEHFKKPWPLEHDRSPILEADCAFAVFPKDVVHLPKRLVAEHSNLKRYTLMPRGGHFGAAEEPTLLTEDIREFFHSK